MEGFWGASIDDFSRRKTMKSALAGMFCGVSHARMKTGMRIGECTNKKELNSGRDLTPHFCLESEIIMTLAFYELAYFDTNCHDGRILGF